MHEIGIGTPAERRLETSTANFGAARRTLWSCHGLAPE
jgi:hypothetical protein